MAGNEPNGTGRMDRLERLMELLIDDHVQFREEHKQLLTAQVVLNDNLGKLTERVDKNAKAIAELTEAQKHTDDRLNALIAVVDGWIRKQPGA
jgi:hypothetical protein